MKKTLITSVLTIGLLFGFGGINTSASTELNNDIESDYVGIQSARAYLSPSKLSAKHLEWKTITVSTNVSGVASFSFHSGINGEQFRSHRTYGSHKFRQRWTTKSISDYTYIGRVTSEDYGPAPQVTGLAKISLY
ncbi:hypothetical protein ACFFIS_04170 [Virgibacillus soli]|uniref:DUF5626 domain-containing protein n=1 Tax=Paracerasibacillus soli TaxID=480284 RepID=A0ABU5CSM4_9BACI|nr:hypothetical protein [Virgibacillus soli]MDY0408837.1 hypothetical protein [Virgibacillus soli]